MLSKEELIWSAYSHYTKEWEYDEKQAVDWVRREFGFMIRELSDLTHEQIGVCYTELGE